MCGTMEFRLSDALGEREKEAMAAGVENGTRSDTVSQGETQAAAGQSMRVRSL